MQKWSWFSLGLLVRAHKLSAHEEEPQMESENSHEDDEGARRVLGLALLHREPAPPQQKQHQQTKQNQNPTRNSSSHQGNETRWETSKGSGRGMNV